MKLINFYNPSLNNDVYSLLVHCATVDEPYPSAKKLIAEEGYYIAKDQYLMFVQLLYTQMDLDIGKRQDERS